VRISRRASLFLLALLYTLLNSVKPLQVDDAAYYYFAAQIAARPLDPYGFIIFWYQTPQPAIEVLAPPVVPYWWAAGIRLFGDRPFWWKVWLLPVSVLFVFALNGLFRRFAADKALLLTWMTVLSPAFLPSLNYMLDVPAVALGLASVLLFFRACDRLHGASAVAAGLVAGVAMQTKYTAFLAPATMVLYALVRGLFVRCLSRRQAFHGVALALLAAGVAAASFAAWEVWVAQKYGVSQFLAELGHSDRDLRTRLEWFGPMLPTLLGGVAPGIGLLGLAALCRRRGVTGGAAILVAAAIGIVAATGSTEVAVHRALVPLPEAWEAFPLTVEMVAFFGLGAVVVGVLAAVAVRLLWRRRRPRPRDAFLVLWLALEVAGYFALTPFGAVRRVLGLVVVGTLLTGRLAALRCRRGAAGGVVRGVVVGNVLLGMLYYAVDLRDAAAEREAAESAAACVRARDPGATTWYAGHWGFQFYAERLGMKPVVPGDPAARLRRGDWLVVPGSNIEQQAFRLGAFDYEPVALLSVDDPLPLRTVRCFYGTATGAPLEHRAGARVSVRVLRMRRDATPGSPPD
jgi:hypothetical protein